MLGFYIDKVARREKEIRDSFNESITAKEILDRTREEYTSVRIPDQEYHNIKNELKQIKSRKKAIQLLIEERRSQLEFEILKQGEELFEDFLESSAQNENSNNVLLNDKKIYGEKIREKMKNEQKQELIKMIKAQYQKRYEDIKSTHFSILDVDRELDSCDALINHDLPEKLQKAEQEKDQLLVKLVSMREQLVAFEQAYTECNQALEELLTKKKEEIYHQNNEIYRDSNFDNIKARIEQVETLIEDKERAIEKNKKTMEESELDSYERNTQSLADIAQMKTRIDNLRKGEQEIKNTVKPQLSNLRKEIKDLSRQIIQSKKKMEGIDDRIDKCRKGIDLAKEAYIEKFKLDPDLITGSGSIKTQYDYPQEYERLSNIVDYNEEDLEEQFKENIEEIKLEEEVMEEQFVQQEPPKEKKKIESVSLDISDLVTLSLKAKQEEAKQKEIEEECEDDLVYIHLINNPTRLKINIKLLAEKDVEFLDSIRPLLEGKEIFKKFSNTISISHIPYNPFDGKKPESCGFGKRMIRLNPEDISQVFFVKKINIRKDGYYLEKREQRKAYNLHVESSLNVQDIMKVIIPKTTADLLKAQKNKANGSKKKSKLPGYSYDPKFDVQQCQYYAFQLICKDTTIEYVVDGYLPFKYITAAFEDLISHKDAITRVGKKIEIVEESGLEDQEAQE